MVNIPSISIDGTWRTNEISELHLIATIFAKTDIMCLAFRQGVQLKSGPLTKP
jgi:hypothetical protein